MNFVLAAAVVLIWSSTWYAIKFQVGMVPPILSVAYRVAIAAFVLWLWCFVKRLPLTFSLAHHRLFMMQGLGMCCLNYAGAYVAAPYINTGLNALIFSMITIFNLLHGALFFGYPVTFRAAGACLLGLTGVATLFWPSVSLLDLSSSHFFGCVMSLAGAYVASLGNMLSIKSQKLKLPVAQTNVFVFAYGALGALIITLVMGYGIVFDTSPLYVGTLIYLGAIGTVVAIGCYVVLLSRVGPGLGSYVHMVVPAFAVGISSVMEDFTWDVYTIFGMALILLGNGLIITSPRTRS